MNLEMEEKSIKQQIAPILKKYKRERKNMIPILQDVQDKLQYLPMEAMVEVAGFFDITPSAVYGVVTFYNQFRMIPPGKHPVKVCLGTACHMKSGELISEAWERELGIKVGEVTEDRQFDLERVACVGCCAMAPVAVVDEAVHGQVTPTRIRGIVDAIKREDKHGLSQDKE
ncbi:MAG: NADH-quinone oxidoreductase subunit NuoE [Chloroflexi bacterium]|jgi:NADH-quinone oxidoreductase subunit E|nr:NADH-quinone oxidoreductase subunit NuoE [Chloroflexota bacterium]MBT7081782.1 NADH-quinone oxidoreductase subunit NuoE [Chloroflexota bacterium]